MIARPKLCLKLMFRGSRSRLSAIPSATIIRHPSGTNPLNAEAPPPLDQRQSAAVRRRRIMIVAGEASGFRRA